MKNSIWKHLSLACSCSTFFLSMLMLNMERPCLFGWSGHWWCGGRKVKSSCTINKARDASVKATNALTTGDKSGYLLADYWKKKHTTAQVTTTEMPLFFRLIDIFNGRGQLIDILLGCGHGVLVEFENFKQEMCTRPPTTEGIRPEMKRSKECDIWHVKVVWTSAWAIDLFAKNPAIRTPNMWSVCPGMSYLAQMSNRPRGWKWFQRFRSHTGLWERH